MFRMGGSRRRDVKRLLTTRHPEKQIPSSTTRPITLDKTAVLYTKPPPHLERQFRSVNCDVPCYWPKNAHGILWTVQVDDVKFTMSMEGEHIYPSLKLSRRDETHRIASTRFASDIPLPYFSWDEYNIQTTPSSFEFPGASFVASNCNSRSGREKMVKELMRFTRVDSYGACLKNKRAAVNNKRQIVRKYAVHLAFENQCVDDYITEKLWGVFDAGVIPIYYGAPNIAEHVPANSIVNVRDFAGMRELARHIDEIASNKTLWSSYHAWRFRPLPKWFVIKYNFTHVHSECRLCRWGLSRHQKTIWDPTLQRAV